MIRFGDCTVDVAAREVRLDGRVQHLEPRAFDVLAHLLAHRERLVAKEELLDEVWGDRFVSESALTTRIKEIRRAIGDDGTQQRLVRNIRGRGYRFVGRARRRRGAAAGADHRTGGRRDGGGRAARLVAGGDAGRAGRRRQDAARGRGGGGARRPRRGRRGVRRSRRRRRRRGDRAGRAARRRDPGRRRRPGRGPPGPRRTRCARRAGQLRAPGRRRRIGGRDGHGRTWSGPHPRDEPGTAGHDRRAGVAGHAARAPGGPQPVPRPGAGRSCRRGAGGRRRGSDRPDRRRRRPTPPGDRDGGGPAELDGTRRAGDDRHHPARPVALTGARDHRPAPHVDHAHRLVRGAAPPEERTAFAELAVFAGPVGMVDITGVLSGDDAFDGVCRLVDRSLAVVDAADGPARYRLLETVRRSASLRLDGSGPVAQTARGLVHRDHRGRRPVAADTRRGRGPGEHRGPA